MLPTGRSPKGNSCTKQRASFRTLVVAKNQKPKTNLTYCKGKFTLPEGLVFLHRLALVARFGLRLRFRFGLGLGCRVISLYGRKPSPAVVGTSGALLEEGGTSDWFS